MKTAQDWIMQLELQPHPEGGYYREMYRSADSISQSALPSQFTGDRSFATHIFFLLSQGNISAFHRIRSDEMWHHYDGEGLELLVLYQEKMQTIRLGKDWQAGEQLFYAVPAGAWFAARCIGQYALMGCTVAPGFDFVDFELAEYAVLAPQYPQYAAVLKPMCIR